MCKYPVSNIQYPIPMMAGADWILDLAVGYWVFAHSNFKHSNTQTLKHSNTPTKH
jgi:hypothetical protein